MESKLLQELMDEKKVNARQVSLAISTHPNIVGYILRGDRNPTLEHIVKLSEYFGVSADYLLGLADSKNNKDEAKAYKAAIDLCKYTEERLGAFKTWNERESYINSLVDYLKSEKQGTGVEIINFAEEAYKRIKAA